MTQAPDGYELGELVLSKAAAAPAPQPFITQRSLLSRAQPAPPSATLADTAIARHAPEAVAAPPAGPLQALMASFPDTEPAATFAYVRRRRPSRVPPPPDPRGGPTVQRSATDVGVTLPLAQRTEFEALVGGPLPDVALHTGPQAASTAAALSADAFATGTDVYFGAGQFDPVNPTGRALLAHELTHVRQQAAGAAVQRTPNSPEGEAEALAVERQVRRGEPPGSQALVIGRVVRRYTTRAQPVDQQLAQRLDALAERALQQAKEALAPQLQRAGDRDISRINVPLTANSASSDEQILAAWSASITAAIRSILTS